MTQKEIFGNAKWLASEAAAAEPLTFSILRSKFIIDKAEKITLKILGLGFFHAFINGLPVSDSEFLPFSTDFHGRRNYPSEEQPTGHRIIVPVFDITDKVKNGENVLAVHFGGGWYTYTADRPESRYGSPKVIYIIEAEQNGSKNTIKISEPGDKICESFVKNYNFTSLEGHDYNGFDDNVLGPDYNETLLPYASVAEDIDTFYTYSDCPPDKIRGRFSPVLVKKEGNRAIYDAGRNLSGVPVLKIKAPAGIKFSVRFSEELSPGGDLDGKFIHNQRFFCVSDGKERTVRPLFTWFGFRYFEISHDGEAFNDSWCSPSEVDFIHTDLKISSAFNSDNEVLNWLYKTYINTQLCNMHSGIPSDCPHLERRGYTGDGQLTCRSAMTVFDAKDFYKKWIDDISDCQDTLTGHVQYTAPYLQSGGGPGAWGCAIVEVPYRYYKEYGDPEPALRLYPQMLKYFEFLEAHSENNIIISDKPGAWCLGDWCTFTPTALPAGFINNYYYIKSLEHAVEIARLGGHYNDIPGLEAALNTRKRATEGAYYNTWDSNFLGNIQGANAFGIDLGLGNGRTAAFNAEYYNKIGHYDTGICGTDVLTKVLFDTGYGETAVRLLTSKDGFGGWMEQGFTTFSEYWLNSTRDRSHNHPMFGSVIAYIFEKLLGITQADDSRGYEDLIIKPFFSEKINTIGGSRTLPCGVVSVNYNRTADNIFVKISLPKGKTARFIYNNKERLLYEGENSFALL